ncbi:MmpS family protein [soil metagenome]
MTMRSMFGWLQRFWVVLVVVVALLVGVAVVGRLRTFFDSDLPFVAGSEHVDAIVPFNTKRVTYEIVGPEATTGRVSYLDVTGKTQEAGFTTLPWSVTVTTTDPGILANVVAQGDSATLGCRILVNDKVVAEQHTAGRDAQAFCLDKAA